MRKDAHLLGDNEDLRIPIRIQGIIQDLDGILNNTTKSIAIKVGDTRRTGSKRA